MDEWTHAPPSVAPPHAGGTFRSRRTIWLDRIVCARTLQNAAPSKTDPPRHEKALSIAVGLHDELVLVRSSTEPSTALPQGVEIAVLPSTT